MDPPCCINDLLSEDILREIFIQLTFQDNVDSSAYPLYDAVQARAPLVLTYVCSRWRQIAIGTRSFWSRLRIAAKNLLVPCGRQELYRMWLERARGTPVSLEIIDVPKSEAQLLDTEGWIEFLLEHVPHLRCLSTEQYVGKAFIRWLLSKPDGSAPSRHLEALRISLLSEDLISNNYHGRISTLFPNLTQLYMDAECYDGIVDIPTKQLTHLSCNTYYFKALLSTGRIDVTFSNLVHLELELLSPYRQSLLWQTQPGHKRLIFPEVRVIKIADTDGQASTTRHFLPAIRTPRLEALYIDALDRHPLSIPYSPPQTGDFSFIAQFLSQAPRLKHVIVDHKHFLTTAFLNHAAIRKGVEHVHVAFSINSTLYQTAMDARVEFGKKWEEQELEIAFRNRPRDENHTAYVGWSNIPDHPLNSFYRRMWALAYWDQ